MRVFFGESVKPRIASILRDVNSYKASSRARSVEAYHEADGPDGSRPIRTGRSLPPAPVKAR